MTSVIGMAISPVGPVLAMLNSKSLFIQNDTCVSSGTS